MYCSGGIFLFKDVNKNRNINWGILVKGVLSFLISTAALMVIFAAIIYFAGIDNKYMPIFGTVCVAFGTFITSYIISKSIGQKGYLTGFLISLLIFIINALISLIIDDGGVTLNTLFHLIIYVLSGVIGGVMGVNKKANTKYI